MPRHMWTAIFLAIATAFATYGFVVEPAAWAVGTGIVAAIHAGGTLLFLRRETLPPDRL